MTDKNIADKQMTVTDHARGYERSAHHSSASPPAVLVPYVPRHRAAIRRIDYSLPVKCLLRGRRCSMYTCI